MTTRTPRLDRFDLSGLIIAILLAIGAYAVSIGFDFVYDDVRIVIERTDLHSLGNWKQILTSTWWPDALYRPLSQISLAIDWAVSDGNPHYFHAVNVVLHVVVVVLVFLLARIPFGPLGATAAAVLFAVHPVHVEAVANVVGRAEVLATLFTVAAALLYHRDGALADANDQSWRRGLSSFGTLGALLLGMASKESALAIPGVLVIVDWLEAQRAGRPLATTVGRHGVLWFGSLGLAVAWLGFRSAIIGDYVGDFPGPGLYGEDFWGRLWVMAPVILQYVRLFVWPYHLSADYSPNYLPAIPSPTLSGLFGLAVLAALIVGAFKMRRGAPSVTFALAWVGGTLLVVSNLIVPSGILLAERSMYLPSVGVVLAAAWLVEWGVVRWRKPTLAVLTVVAALGTIRTVSRVPVWKDPDTFFIRLVQDAPSSFRSQWVAGMIWYNSGDRERGEQLLWSAINTYPLFANVWSDLGKQLQQDSRWLEAARTFEAAFRIDSSRVDDAASAVTNYVRADFPDSAQAVAERARNIDPHHARVLLAWSDIAMERERPLEAMTLRRQANLAAPQVQGYWYLTADAAIRAKYCPEAVHSTGRLRELNPEYSELEQLDERISALGCTP